MNRKDALEQITSTDQHSRLQAARFLARFAQPGDREQLQSALRSETVLWIRTALATAIDRAQGGGLDEPGSAEQETPSEEMESVERIRTMAVQEVTQQLVHEIRPILGLIMHHAGHEIASYEQSETRKHLERLGMLLTAFDRLNEASAAPELSEFDVSELLRSIIANERGDRALTVEAAGPTPLIVLGDRTLIEIVLRNGVANAIEATEGQPPEPGLVVVSWGETDRDYWVSVLDKGPGPPSSPETAFRMGSTTKEEHVGMGLALARQASASLSGTITLEPRSQTGGARFSFRWPKLSR